MDRTKDSVDVTLSSNLHPQFRRSALPFEDIETAQAAPTEGVGRAETASTSFVIGDGVVYTSDSIEVD